MEAAVLSTTWIGFPNELLALIVGCLQDEEDTASLLSCCLASRTLCSISQPYIFSFVDFEVLIAAPLSLSAVTESRHLAGYITAARVSFTKLEPELEVLRVLPLLHNVDRLDLTGLENHCEVPEILTHALQQTIFPTIKILTIHRATVSIFVLASLCPMLVELILDDVPPLLHVGSPEPLPIAPLLRSITVDDYESADFAETSSLTALLCRVQHTLHTMVLESSQDSFLLWYRPTFLKEFGHSLVHLYICADLFDDIAEDSLPPTSFQFSLVPQLQIFHTQVRTWNGPVRVDHFTEIKLFFDVLAVSLRACPKPHPLRKLIFDVVDADDALEPEGERGGPKLDTVLCDRELLPDFKSVVFNFPREEHYERARGWVRSVLPLADREGLLSFSKIRDLFHLR